MERCDEIVVLLTPKQQRRVWEVQGAATVVDALKDAQKSAPPVVGMTLALSVAEGVLAEMRVGLGQMALKAAAGAGHDINKTPTIECGVRGGEAVLLLAAPDLFGGEEP